MATQGPTATTTDVTTFANFATWAGNSTGMNSALTNFGWTRTADLNQIQWASSPTAAPFAGNTYPITNQPTTYTINARGNWVSGSNYAIGDVVFDTTTQSSYYTFLAIVNSTTVPSSDTTHFLVYHYEMWQTNDTLSFNVTNVSRTAGGLATFLCTNRFKAGFVVVISGLTNVPSLNGRWTVFSASSSQFTVQTGGSTIGSTADSATAVYTPQPICMKLEYWGNNASFSTAPWIRLSFGTSTDGLGNLSGNLIGSNAAGSQTAGFIYCDLRISSSTPSGAQTSSIWRNIWSGNNSRFGTTLFYNRNDNNTANQGTMAWVVERGHDDIGNEIDDYFTYVVLSNGNAGVFTGTQTNMVQQRSIFKPNPQVTISSVVVDGSNNLSLTYTNKTGYQLAAGATVYLSGFEYATFLNDQFLTINPIALTSVANASAGSTVYTGTIPNGGNNFYAGQNITVAGFVTAANNGTFACTASTTTTLTLTNASGVAETRAATAQASSIVNAVFTQAAYPQFYESSSATMRLSISSSTFTPIVGTGLVMYSDPRPCTPYTSLSSLSYNGFVPLLPVFPIVGFLGNPLTMCQAVRSGDEPAHDTTTTITLYGATRTYYFPQGNTSTFPYIAFGGSPTSNIGGFTMRWD
jgi:hypothetical protein